MAHLSAAVLVDLMDGVASREAARHAAGCNRCRQALASIEGQAADLARLSQPTDQTHLTFPSPLFWDHFPARVMAAVNQAPIPERTWRDVWVVRHSVLATSFGTLTAAVLLAVALVWHPAPAAHPDGPSAAAAGLGGDPQAGDDVALAAWALMTALSADVDWDAAVDAGMATRPGGADGLVSELSTSEQRELDRLLKEALARRGA